MLHMPFGVDKMEQKVHDSRVKIWNVIPDSV